MANKRRISWVTIPIWPGAGVSYTDSEGLAHAIDVEAEFLYEAVALAVAEFR